MRTYSPETSRAENAEASLGNAALHHSDPRDLDSIVQGAPDPYVVSGSLFDKLLRAAWQAQLNRCK